MLTTPIFKPFVPVRIAPPSGYSSGEVMALNEAGQAVGWMWNDSAEVEYPFFFDPAGGVTMLDLPTGADAGGALSLNSDDPPMIVGYAHDTTLDEDLGAVWSSDGDFDGYIFDVETPIHGNGVNASERIACNYKDSGDNHSLVWEDEYNYWNPASTTSSAACGVNSSGKVVGWHLVSSVSHAYTWVPDTLTDIHPNPFDASGALAINDGGYIGGWVDDDGEFLAALWTPLTPGVYTVEPFAAGADAAVMDLNDEGEMVIMRTDGTAGVAIWNKRGSINSADLLDSITLMRGATDVIASGRAINNAGWIGGSYKAGGTGDPLPCLVIPYDVDNNGEPDYREILDDPENLDSNDNWLLDWAENMRVGLHSPNSSADPEGAIDPAQLVRLGVNVGPAGIEDRPESIAGEYWVEDILHPEVDDCASCTGFHTAVTSWGTGEGRANENLTSEILIRVHSMMGPEEFGDSEALPDPEAPQEKQAALDDLRLFAYRFARCIDYLQWGNESFGGARGYRFREDEFDCDSFDEGTLFQYLPANCKALAVSAVQDWQAEMLWAALEGSALAGRPLRMTSCGISDGNVYNGYEAQDPNDAGRYLTTKVADWCNSNQAYFSMHVHYNEAQPALDAIQRLVDETGAPWDVPNWRISTEVGAMADFQNDDWWLEEVDPFGVTNIQIHQMFFWGTTNPPTGESWEDFINRWESDADRWNPVGLEAGFRIDDLFGEFNDADFVGLCWSTLQWDKGSVGQPSRFLVEGLRATQVRNDEDLFESGNYTNRYTPIMEAYETTGATYKIANFAPHAFGCDESEVCPGCGGQ
ncbi:MAG: hypothetical protein IT430_11635 [Phycisphaerales bacterium]|nr:hypothetical protein [Phycisphaerales bacterium]